jgi:hypothetical protein
MSCGRLLRLLVVALAAVAGLAVLPVLSTGTAAASSPLTNAEVLTWYQGVVADLSPLQSGLVDGLQAASGWENGSEKAVAAGAAIGRDLSQLQTSRAKLESLKPLPGHARVLHDYQDALGLYVDAFNLEQAATALPPGPLVTQLQRSFARVRELGDATFDQGTAVLAPQLGPTIAGPDVKAAAKIPDWSAQHLAPGRPLVASWRGAHAAPAGTQSAAAWHSAVARSGAPAQSAVRSAVAGSGSSTAPLARLAGKLNRAEVQLSSVRGPKKSPRASALTRIAYLADAEAVLAAEEAKLSGVGPNPAVLSVAKSLAAIGGDLRSQS